MFGDINFIMKMDDFSLFWFCQLWVAFPFITVGLLAKFCCLVIILVYNSNSYTYLTSQKIPDLKLKTWLPINTQLLISWSQK